MDKVNILSAINSVHLENLGLSSSPTIFVDTTDYKILHLRLVKFADGELVYNAHSYIIFKNKIYSVSKEKEVTELSGQYKELYQSINLQIKYSLEIVFEHERAIELLEEKVLDRKKLTTTLTEIFDHKKQLMKLERVFDRLSFVLMEFNRFEADNIISLSKEYNDLQADSSFMQRLAKAQIAKLDNIYSLYTSIKNDALNRNIYILSIISGVFLPLNLIVGFFGMNTQGLFLGSNPNASTIVLYVIISTFCVMLLGLPLLHFLDKLLVSKLLGRFKFYSKISGRLEQMNENFNILDKK